MFPLAFSAIRSRFGLSSETVETGADAGFTLIEVVVSFIILMITSLGLIAAMVTGARATNNSQQRTVANNIAKQYIESARAPGSLATPITTPITVISGVAYSVCRLVAPVPSVAAPSSAAPSPSLTTCTSSPGVTASTCPGLVGMSYYVSVIVTWATNLASLNTSSILGRVRTDTVIAC